MRAVFLDIGTYAADERFTRYLDEAHSDWVYHDITPPDQLAARMQGADIVATNKCRLTREVLEQCGDLKLIVAGATGVDNIDIKAAKDLGVRVCNVRGYSTDSVAQLTWMLILALAGNLPRYHDLVQRGAWENSTSFNLLNYPITELAGKTLGLVGYGDIGRAVEKIATAFGMDVVIAERRGADTIRAGRTAFEDVLTRSDVLSVHCPLTDQTRGLIGTAELARMKDTAILINTARGGIVDEADLAVALKGGDIAGAGLDVLAQEPPRDGTPVLADGIPNIIITPHCAWASEEARLRMFKILADNITAYKNGDPINVVV